MINDNLFVVLVFMAFTLLSVQCQYSDYLNVRKYEACVAHHSPAACK